MFKSAYNGNITKQKYAVTYFLCFAIVLVNILSAISGIFVNNSNNAQIDAADLWSTYTQTATKDNDGYCIINSPEKFSWFFYKSTESKAKIICDIDMSAHTWDSPKVSRNIELNGLGHIVYGLSFVANSEIKVEDTFLDKSSKSYSFHHIYSGLIGLSSSGNITFNNLSLHLEKGLDLLPNASYKFYRNFGGFVGYKSNGNLNINNCSVFGDFQNKSDNTYGCNLGAFVGYSKNLVANNCFSYVKINLSNKSITESIVTPSGKPLNTMLWCDSFVGGIVGSVSSSCTFKLCGNYGDIISNATYLGGIAGKTVGLNLNNARCFNSGNISIKPLSSKAIGGLIGYSENANNKTISSVYNTGTICDVDGNIIMIGINNGTIMGYSEDEITINNLYTISDFETKTSPISTVKNLTAKELCPEKYWPKSSIESNFWVTKDGSYKYDFCFSGSTTDTSGYSNISQLYCQLDISTQSINTKGPDILGNKSNLIIGKNVFYYTKKFLGVQSISGFTIDVKIREKTKTTDKVLGEVKQFISSNSLQINQEKQINNVYDKYLHQDGSWCLDFVKYWGNVARSFDGYTPNSKFKSIYAYLGREYEMFKYMHEYLGGDTLSSRFGKAYTWDGGKNKSELSSLISEIRPLNFCGVSLKRVSQYDIEIVPLLKYTYNTTAKNLYNKTNGDMVYIPVEQIGKYIFNFDSVDSNMITSTKSNLTFDESSGFARSDSINDGLPVFKEMYWEFV